MMTTICQENTAFDPVAVMGSKCWGWWWADYQSENLTLTSVSGGQVWTQCLDSSGNNRTLTAITGNEPGWRDVGTVLQGDGPTPYTTLTPCIAVNELDSGDYFKNESTLAATKTFTGDFYIGLVLVNTRNKGDRYLWSRSTSDWLRFDQERGRMNIMINGSQHRVIDDGGIGFGPQAVEIYREGGILTSRVNGTDTSVSLAGTGTWQVKDFGVQPGGGGSQLDDYVQEVVLGDQALDSAEKDLMSAYYDARHGISDFFAT